MNNKSNENPLYVHDCTHCTFLGRHEGYDLYHCMKSGHPTVIARHGNSGEEYLSGMVFGISDVQEGDFNSPLAQAYMRAKALDLKVTM
jgi:hypothetical protein